MSHEWLLWALLLPMTWCGALGGVFFKHYAMGRRKMHLLTGAMFYGAGALVNIYLLKHLPYTIVMPANALTYVWALLLAKRVFKESVGAVRMTGVAFIIAGLVWLASS